MLSGVWRDASCTKPPRCSSASSSSARALGPQPLDAELELGHARGDALVEAEVEEGHAAVVEQHRVARVRVARELVEAVHRPEVEAEDDLAQAVALGLGQLLELLEAASGDELRHDHPLARKPVDHVGHDDERVAAEQPRHRALVGGLELVVELLVDAQADLLGHRLRVEARARRASSAAGSARGSACRPARPWPRPGTAPSPRRRARRGGAPGRPGRSRRRRSGPGRRCSKSSSSGSSNSASITRFMSLKETFGAASRSSASLAWKSSRNSSGTRPTSRNDMTWPSFIAAPFIVPSAATICSAVSSWRRESAACAESSSRVRLAARVPIWRAACSAARRPSCADRRTRDVGIGSLSRRPSRRGWYGLPWPVLLIQGDCPPGGRPEPSAIVPALEDAGRSTVRGRGRSVLVRLPARRRGRPGRRRRRRRRRVRATLTWDTDDTDIDLHVWTPTGEHAWWKDQSAASRARGSRRTSRSGFGPKRMTDTAEGTPRTFTYGPLLLRVQRRRRVRPRDGGHGGDHRDPTGRSARSASACAAKATRSCSARARRPRRTPTCRPTLPWCAARRSVHPPGDDGGVGRRATAAARPRRRSRAARARAGESASSRSAPTRITGEGPQYRLSGDVRLNGAVAVGGPVTIDTATRAHRLRRRRGHRRPAGGRARAGGRRRALDIDANATSDASSRPRPPGADATVARRAWSRSGSAACRRRRPTQDRRCRCSSTNATAAAIIVPARLDLPFAGASSEPVSLGVHATA